MFDLIKDSIADLLSCYFVKLGIGAMVIGAPVFYLFSRIAASV